MILFLFAHASANHIIATAVHSDSCHYSSAKKRRQITLANAFVLCS